jgi:hypothetical protein
MSLNGAFESCTLVSHRLWSRAPTCTSTNDVSPSVLVLVLDPR